MRISRTVSSAAVVVSLSTVAFLSAPPVAAQRISQPPGMDQPNAAKNRPAEAKPAPANPNPQSAQNPQNAQDRITQSLRKMYPDRQVRLGTPQSVNGVHVYDATLEGKGGAATAKVTEFGDVLVATDGTKLEYVAPPVAQTLRGLFQKPNDEMQVIHTTRYLVDVRVNNKPWRLVLNPTGQLVDIRSEQRIKEDDGRDFPQANDQQRGGVRAVAEQYFPGGKIDQVRQFPEAPDFFVVDLKLPNNQEGRLVMHGAKEVTVAEEELAANQLPPPVRDAVQRMFSSKVERAARYNSKHYQVVQPTAQNTQVVVQLTPSGRITYVSNPAVQSLEQQAIPAAQRQQPGR